MNNNDIFHNNIIKNIEILPKNYIYNDKKCICTLIWEYIYPNIELPKLLRYIEDRELNKYEMKNSKKITEGIYNYLSIGDFSIWNKFMNNESYYLNKCKELGEIMMDIKEQKNMLLIDKGIIYDIENYKVFIMNINDDIKYIGEYLCNMKDESNNYLCDYALLWNYDMSEEIFIVTLISNKKRDINVYNISKRYTDQSYGNKYEIKFKSKKLLEILSKYSEKNKQI
jgi:hypothetical protein